jgi:hypothetical protein
MEHVPSLLGKLERKLSGNKNKTLPNSNSSLTDYRHTISTTTKAAQIGTPIRFFEARERQALVCEMKRSLFA